MAVTKIWQIRTSLNRALRYIFNPNKTDDQILVTGHHVEADADIAALEFEMTAIQSKEYGNRSGTVKAYHVIQSFDVSDKISSKEAHKLGIELAKSVLGEDDYEFCVATHIDRKCVHNHIIFNAVSRTSLKKFRCEPYKTAAFIRRENDRICRENKLHVIKDNGLQDRGLSYYEWKKLREGKSYKNQIKGIIDDAIFHSKNYDEFREYLIKNGIEIKPGKRTSYRLLPSSQERFVRGDRIGKNYSTEKIIERISDPQKMKSYLNSIKYREQRKVLSELNEISSALSIYRSSETLFDLEDKITEYDTKVSLNQIKINQIERIIKYLSIINSKRTAFIDKKVFDYAVSQLKICGIENCNETELNKKISELRTLKMDNTKLICEREKLANNLVKVRNAEYTLRESVEKNVKQRT